MYEKNAEAVVSQKTQKFGYIFIKSPQPIYEKTAEKHFMKIVERVI
jgi:hypothetical protein